MRVWLFKQEVPSNVLILWGRGSYVHILWSRDNHFEIEPYLSIWWGPGLKWVVRWWKHTIFSKLTADVVVRADVFLCALTVRKNTSNFRASTKIRGYNWQPWWVLFWIVKEADIALVTFTSTVGQEYGPSMYLFLHVGPQAYMGQSGMLELPANPIKSFLF